MIRSIKNFLRNSIYSRRSGISKKLKSKSILKSKDLKYFVKSFGNKNPNKKFYVIQRFIGGGMFSNLNYIMLRQRNKYVTRFQINKRGRCFCLG